MQCLQSFARIGGEGLDAWPAPGAEGPNARAVCASVVALLEGPRSDSACLFVGPLVSTMLLRMPSLMAPCVARVVEAVLRRLGRCEMPLVSTRLVVVFARLAALDAPRAIDLLCSVQCGDRGHGGGAGATGLGVAMHNWTLYHSELQGEYTIKMSAVGLMRVLSTLDARLQEVIVTGREVFKNPDVITTRSRARGSAPSEWTRCPVPIKIIALLLDQYAELQEAERDGAGGACAGDADEDQDEYGEDEYEEDFADADDAEFDDDDEDEDVDFFGDDIGGDGGAPDELDARDDPLGRVELQRELGAFLRNLTTSEVGVSMIKGFVDEFSRRQLEVIHACSA